MSDTGDTIEALLRRRKVLADFGDVALPSEGLDAVLTLACRWSAGEALGTGSSKVLKIERGGETLFVRAGVGWAADMVGHLRPAVVGRPSEARATGAGEPVISQDIAKEDRFDVPPFIKGAGVMAVVNGRTVLPGRRAHGLLQVDDSVPRDIDEDDLQFLRTCASILGPAIDRLLKLHELPASEERFRPTLEAATGHVLSRTDTENPIADRQPPTVGASRRPWVDQAPLCSRRRTGRRTSQGEVDSARQKASAPDERWHSGGVWVLIERSMRAL